MNSSAVLSHLLHLARSPYVVAGVLATAWGLVEIIQTFESDLKRALKTLWVYIFLGGHFLITCFVLFALDLTLSLNLHQRLGLGILIGFGWQALLRTRINLFQPLTEDQSESVALSILDFYRRFQNICWRQTDRSLLAGRVELLDRAGKHLSLDELKRQVLLIYHASIVHPSDSDKQRLDDFLKQLGQRPEEEQRLYLAAYLLQEGGYDFVMKLVRRAKEHPRSDGSANGEG